MGVDLIVFDCDGVLVDSEALVIDVESELLTAAGFPISAAEITERFVGLSYESMMAALATEHGRPVPDDVSQRVQKAAIEQFPGRLQAVPGMDALLQGLTTPFCLASSSDLDRINLSLSVTGLDVHFSTERIFSAQMVANGKPAPDLFELAASELGVTPERCLVVEDSPPGVAAALAANMRVVGLVAGGHANEGLAGRLASAGAEHIFPTASELAAHLGS